LVHDNKSNNKSNCPTSLRYHYIDVRQYRIQEYWQDNVLRFILTSYQSARSTHFTEQWDYSNLQGDQFIVRDYYLGFDNSELAEQATKRYFVDLFQDVYHQP